MNIDVSNVDVSNDDTNNNSHNEYVYQEKGNDASMENDFETIELNDNSQDRNRNNFNIDKIRNIRCEDNFQDHIIVCEDEPPEVQRMKIVLNMIRKNCVKHSLYHNARYHFYRKCLVGCFRVPALILSSLNGFFAVGLQKYMVQSTISLINAILSLFCGILTGVEILLNLQKRMECEMDTYKKYYKLSVEIKKELITYLHKNDHKYDKIRDFLDKKYNEYQSIVSASYIVTNHNRMFYDEFEIIADNRSENKRKISKLSLGIYNAFDMCKSSCCKYNSYMEDLQNESNYSPKHRSYFEEEYIEMV